MLPKRIGLILTHSKAPLQMSWSGSILTIWRCGGERLTGLDQQEKYCESRMIKASLILTGGQKSVRLRNFKVSADKKLLCIDALDSLTPSWSEKNCLKARQKCEILPCRYKTTAKLARTILFCLTGKKPISRNCLILLLQASISHKACQNGLLLSCRLKLFAKLARTKNVTISFLR